MKTPPPAKMPEGGTPSERLDRAFRTILTVPKDALLKEEAREETDEENKLKA